MHMVIRAIVFATSQDEALEKGKEVFDKLTHGEDGSAGFDYYTTFDEQGTTVSGEARWGAMPPASPIISKKGRQLMVGGLAANRRDFLRSLAEVKKEIMAKTPRELFEGDSMFGYYAKCLYLEAGSSCWLYDDEGSPIRNKTQLRETLAGGYGVTHATYRPEKVRTTKHKIDPNEPQAWVVPADVHH